MDFDKIHLLPKEKFALFILRFKKKRLPEEIANFNLLHDSYHFIQNNQVGIDEFGAPEYDGTYSLSDTYFKYKIYLREKKSAKRRATLALLISLINLLWNIIEFVVDKNLLK